MRGSENYPVLHAVLQENLSGPLPKSALLALKPSQRSSNSSTASDTDLPIIGGVLKDGRYSWLSRGSKLVIVSSKTSSVISVYDFNQAFRELRFTVATCCTCENLIVIGLKGQDGRGCIAVYNPLIRKLLKAIDIPYPVSAVEVITCRGGAVASTRCLCKNLRWMFGIVAVGTEEGHLYLVDLRFDSPHSLESIPSQIEIVSPSLRNVPRTRENIVAENGYLAFELQASCHEDGVFHYALPDDEIFDSFYPSDATITTVLYEPRVAALFVGFSFGQFQIFSLHDNMTLVHSSDFDGNSTPILKFAFQEPENDPRKYCYLWVARGNKPTSRPPQRSSEPLTLSMFQLCYAKKEILARPKQEFEQRTKDLAVRVLYKNFEVCNQRFEHCLGPSFISNMSLCYGSTLLMCSSLEKYISEAEPLNPPEEEDIDYSLSPSTSFCVFGWQSMKAGRQRDAPEVNVIVFDINRWYMAQMPQSFRDDEDDFLFAAFWSFENDARLLAEDEEILGMHVPTDKIQHFLSGMRPLPERYFLPSACNFSLHYITNQSLNHFSLFGYQQQVLNAASEMKSMCLVNPKEIHDDILASELYSRHTRNQAFTPDMMRENILTTALEHGQIGFLLSVVRDLASGHLAACGCTLRFVMDWAWKSVANVKNAVDELCVPIFDCTSPTLDALVRSRLQFNTTQIHHLRIVFQKLMEYTEDSSDQSKEGLQTKLNVVTLIYQYLKVVQWFIGNGLLPEQLDNIENNEEIMTPSGILIYKYARLRQVFDQRRGELHRLQAPDLLLIDGWVEEIGDPLTSRWLKEEGGKTSYPPPSFMTLLDMYYLDCVDVVTKHCLVMYLLFDVLAMFSTLEGEDKHPNAELHESQRERLNNIATFLESFSVPSGTINLTQAFWLLDHKNFQDALNVFLDPDTSRPDSSWQERRILRAFLYQGHPEMSLKYISARHPKVETLDDAKMHITIFVRTREPLKAWDLVQMSEGQHDNKELFSHMFTLCQKHSQLDQLLKLPFSALEEAMVIKYLRDSDSSEATQILVLFYLQQSKYVEAIKLHSQSKHIRLMRDQSDESRRRNAKLDHIVQSYSNLLPNIERELSFSGNRFLKQRHITQKEVYKPSSLSAVLHPSLNIEASSHAGRLVSLIDKMEQKKRAAQETAMTPLRRRPYGGAIDSRLQETSTFIFPTIDTTKRRSSIDVYGMLGRRSSFGSPARPSASRDSRETASRSTTSKPGPMGVKERRLSSLSVASMLLQTPPISRRRSSIGQQDVARDIQTPQSILKVKKLFKREREKSPSLSGHSQSSSRLNFEFAKAEDDQENADSDSIFSEESTHIKHDIPTISTPSAKLFMQRSALEIFKSDVIKVESGEQKFPVLDTPKRLRFAGLDSSANDSGLSAVLSPPIKQVAGLPHLTPVRIAAEDSAGDDEMEVDVLGDESEEQEENETSEEEDVPEQENDEPDSEISVIPTHGEQRIERLELSDVEELEEEEQEEEEEEEEEEAHESDESEEDIAVPQVSDPSHDSEEVICLDSSSEEEVEPQEEEPEEIQEEEDDEEQQESHKEANMSRQGNESLRLVLTSSEESLVEEEEEMNKGVQDEEGYETEEFTVGQEESRDAEPHPTEILTPISLIHSEIAAEIPLEQEDDAGSSDGEDASLENLQQEEKKEAAVPTDDEPHHKEPSATKNQEEVVTKDVFLGQLSAEGHEEVGEEGVAGEYQESVEEQDEQLTPELLVPHLGMEPQEEIEILISDDESDVEETIPEESGESSPTKDESQDVAIEQDEGEEFNLHLSSSDQEFSCESPVLEERQKEDSETDENLAKQEDARMLNPDEATSDYQSMSATKMEEDITSPEQEENPEGTEEEQQEASEEIIPGNTEKNDVDEIAESVDLPQKTEHEDVTELKTPEKGPEIEKHLPRVEIVINPSTPVIDKMKSEPTFVLSPPTTRRSNRRPRESKATQYTPKPDATAEKEKKVQKSPSRVTRSSSSTHTQVSPGTEPTFLFSPPKTRKRSSRKKDQSILESNQSTITLSPPRSTTKRTRSRTKSPNIDSDHSSTSVSPLRRSPRTHGGENTKKAELSSPERKPPSTPTRKTRQSPGRKAPLTPTRSSSRIKAKHNLTAEPETPSLPEPELSEDIIPVLTRTRRRKTSVSSDVTSDSEAPSTPSRRSTRKSTSTSKSKTPLPSQRTVKAPKLTPLHEEKEEEASIKKRKAPGRTSKVTRSTASYPTRMRRKAKIFKLEE